MKNITLLFALVLSVGVLPVIAAPERTTADTSVAPVAPDAAWLAQAQAAYPLKTCVVSGEDLGGMGDVVDYVYQQEGKPDRLVRFCCKMCLPKFKKDPAKYLTKINEATVPAKKS